MKSVDRVPEVVNPQALQRLALLLRGVERVAIFCHARPDGDAIGSSVGLGNLLTLKGVEVMCIAPNKPPAHVAWCDSHGLVRSYEEEGAEVRAYLPTCELFFCLDFNDLSRLDEPLMLHVDPLSVPRVMIDHHPYPTAQFDLYFSMPETSSTCELLTEVILGYWGAEAITPEVAVPLYMGLMTDTGSFSYSCSRKRTFEITGELISRGVDVPSVHSAVYNSRSLNSLMLQSYLLAHKTTFFARNTCSIMCLDLDLQREYDYQPGDAEGIANLPLTVDTVQISVLLTERQNGTVRVSTRSTKRYAINSLMSRYFNGGGHPQASGGTLRMPISEAKRYTRQRLEEFLREA